MLFQGSGVAIVTPFTEQNEIDYTAFNKLINFQIDKGIDAIVVIGTTGEAATLSKEEKVEIIQHTVKQVDNRIPVIAGTGSNNTVETVKWSQEVSELGVDGLLVVSPYYNKGSHKGLIEHFTQVADISKVPVMLYSVPGRTGMNIPVDVVVELSKHDNIVGIKDAAANLNYTAEVRRLTDEKFQIISGNDDIIVPMLSLGAEGVISVVANVLPKETSEMVHSFLNGDIKKARDLQLQLTPFINAAFSEPSPIPIKTATHLLQFGTDKLRLPLTEAEDETKRAIKEEMERLNLL